MVRRAVLPLVDTPVTPNQLTTLRLATGVAAAAAFAVDTPGWRAAAAALFLLSFLLDRADGELARLTGRTTPWGHSYDLFCDAACNGLVFVGIGVGLRESVLGGWSTALGILAGAAVAAILWMVVRVEERAGARAAEFDLHMPVDPDDAMIIVPVTMLLGGGVPLIVAAAVGAPAFACFMYLRLRGHLRQGATVEV